MRAAPHRVAPVGRRRGQLPRPAALVAALLLALTGACAAPADPPPQQRREGPAAREPAPSSRHGQTAPRYASRSRSDGPAHGSCPDAASLPLRSQLAQTLFVGVDGSSDRAVRELVAGAHPVGGIFVGGEAARVFSSGVLREAAGRRLPPLVAVYDEGGRVQRIAALAGDLPSAEELGRLPRARIRALAEARGRRLARMGVTMLFAPVVDLGGRRDHHVIGNRAFAPGPREVTADAGAFAAGVREAGVLPTLKHFPGHGRTVGDSHLGPVTTPPWSDLLRADVLPYRTLTRREPVAVMVGHLAVPGLTRRALPTSLDPAAYRALRRDVGFRGLAVTDDLSAMRAVSARYGQAEAARRALAAGADMALLVSPRDVPRLLDHLAGDVAAGRLTRDRVAAAAAAVLGTKTC